MSYVPPLDVIRAASYHVLKPPAIGFKDNYYVSSESGIRGGDTGFTVGMLSLVRDHKVTGPSGNIRQVLFTCHDGSEIGAQGYTAWHEGAVAPNSRTGLTKSEVRNVIGWPDYLDSAESGHNSFEHHIVSCGLQLTVMVIDDSVYSQNLFNINGRTHDTPAWSSSGMDSAKSLYLGRGTPTDPFYNNGALRDWIVAFFYHTEPMTEEEIFVLRQNIEIAHDIPLIDYIGGGVVPDHIWSARYLALGAAPSTWESLGATGGKDFNLVGSLDIVPANPVFTSR